MYSVTLNQLIQFNSILPSLQELKLPLSTAFALNKIREQLETSYPFYQESLRQIILDCGDLDENGQIKPSEDGTGILLKEGSQADFYQRLSDLEQISVDIQGSKIPMSALDNESFTMEQATILMPFLEEN